MSTFGDDEPQKIRACTVARKIEDFDLLIEDMEAIYGEDWGNLSVQEAIVFLKSAEADELNLVAIVLETEDDASLGLVRTLIETASAGSARILIIAEAISPIILHQLLRAGADDFVPYPLPENALKDSLEKLNKPVDAGIADTQRAQLHGGKSGVVYAVQSLGGGCGGTTFATNLAWELCKLSEKQSKTACILDFDFQSGSVSTYLDLPRTEKVYEFLSQTSSMDEQAFFTAMQVFQERLHVLTAPSDMLPLDLLTPDEIERVIAMARKKFDFVVVDMPRTVVHWTESVLNMSDLYFLLLELDLRSAQNTLRMIRAMKADGIDLKKFRFLLNRAPKFTDLGGKSRAKRMAESLDIEFAVSLPDGGTQIRDANDHGLPLAEYAPKNPLYKEIHKFAALLHESAENATVAAE